MAISSTGDTKLGGTSLHIVINPKATYLRTNGDASALNATAINLTALGIAAGDILVIEQTGTSTLTVQVQPPIQPPAWPVSSAHRQR